MRSIGGIVRRTPEPKRTRRPAPTRRTAGDDGRSRLATLLLSRALWMVVASIVTVAVVTVFLLPTQELLAQRADIDELQGRVDATRLEVLGLEQQLEELERPETVERLARERFGFVRDGEQAYRLQPPARDAADFPDTWPWPGFERLVNGR